MFYTSTRDNHPPVPAADAIRLGMVPAGGLFVPESFPRFDITSFKGTTYPELAEAILGLFLTDYTKEELHGFCTAAYAPSKFDHPDIAPLHHLDNGLSVLELWHGPTAAFKDMALQLMPTS
jgi:threonine synthase